jgi:hypothetical protein
MSKAMIILMSFSLAAFIVFIISIALWLAELNRGESLAFVRNWTRYKVKYFDGKYIVHVSHFGLFRPMYLERGKNYYFQLTKYPEDAIGFEKMEEATSLGLHFRQRLDKPKRGKRGRKLLTVKEIE